MGFFADGKYTLQRGIPPFFSHMRECLFLDGACCYDTHIHPPQNKATVLFASGQLCVRTDVFALAIYRQLFDPESIIL